MQNNASEIKTLQKAIERKFGMRITTESDCRNLADRIEDKTGRSLSITTLKRLWGLIDYRFRPAKYTLDTLALFLGYDSWKDFEMSVKKVNYSKYSHSLWNDLKQKAMHITGCGLISIKKSKGEFYDKAILRDFAIQKIEAFVQSDKTATAFIGNGGSGKTTTLAKIVENMFLAPASKYSSDIVFFIDGRIYDSLKKIVSFDDSINQLMGLGANKNYRQLFTNKNMTPKGRIILIFDAINELSLTTEYLSHWIDKLLKLIALNNRSEWFKIIISCRPYLWNFICQKINEHPLLKNQWFDVIFDGNYLEKCNIPTLKDDEIDEIMEKQGIAKRIFDIRLKNAELYEILKFPYFLQIYLSQQSQDSEITEMELFHAYADKIVFNHHLRDEKLKLLHRLIESASFGKAGNSINKSGVIKHIDENIQSYNSLLSYGILYEDKSQDKYLSLSTTISFSHEVLFEYFIADTWTSLHDFDEKLIDTIVNYYQNHHELQSNILKWLIRQAFYYKNIPVLKNIYKSLSKHFNGNDKALFASLKFQELITLVGYNFRKYNDLRHHLVPYYAENPLERYCYFQRFIDLDYLVIYFADTMHYYLLNTDNAKEKIFAHTVLFRKYFQLCDEKNCRLHYEIIRGIKELPLENVFIAGAFFGCQILYQHFITGKIDENVMDEIKKTGEKIYTGYSEKKLQGMPHFYFIMVDIFHYCRLYRDVLYFCDIIFANFDISKKEKNSRLFRFLMLFYADARLQCGCEISEVQDRFEADEMWLDKIPVTTKHYWRSRYYLLKAGYLAKRGELKEAAKMLIRVKRIASQLKYFHVKEMANKLAQQTGQ